MLPICVHPKKFNISGILIEVTTCEPVTDEQAAKIALHFFAGRKFKKSHQGKLFRVVSLFDRASAAQL